MANPVYYYDRFPCMAKQHIHFNNGPIGSLYFPFICFLAALFSHMDWNQFSVCPGIVGIGSLPSIIALVLGTVQNPKCCDLWSRTESSAPGKPAFRTWNLFWANSLLSQQLNRAAGIMNKWQGCH